MSSEDSLTCHTLCDNGHPFAWSYLRARDNNTYFGAFGSGAFTTNDFGMSRPAIELKSTACEAIGADQS